MTVEMAFSLPGITELAIRMVSPSPTRILWSRFAIRESAAIGSPCEPVQIRVALLAGRRSSCSSGTMRPLRDLQVAQVLGHPHVADHRAPDEGHLAAVGVGLVEDLLDAVHVAGEAGDDDPPRRGPEDGLDRRHQVTLGGGEAGDLGVRGVGHEEVDALVGQPGEAAEVGDPAVQRELVHLEVARVQDETRRGPDRDREGVGDRVVDRDELAVELPEVRPVALAHLPQLRADPVLLHLLLHQRQREPGAEDGDVGPLLEEVGHAADVVLVAVRQDQPDHRVEAVPDPGEVREDDVHAGLVLLGEQHAAVDDEQLALVLEDGHVATDLAQPAQAHDPQALLRQAGRALQLGVRMAHGELRSR